MERTKTSKPTPEQRSSLVFLGFLLLSTLAAHGEERKKKKERKEGGEEFSRADPSAELPSSRVGFGGKKEKKEKKGTEVRTVVPCEGYPRFLATRVGNSSARRSRKRRKKREKRGGEMRSTSRRDGFENLCRESSATGKEENREKKEEKKGKKNKGTLLVGVSPDLLEFYLSASLMGHGRKRKEGEKREEGKNTDFPHSLTENREERGR